MAIKDTFTVNVSGGQGHVVTWLAPESLDDAQWEKRIAGDHTEKTTLKVSRAVANAINELAKQTLVIKMQGASRGELPKGKAAVQAKVDGYCYGAKAAPSAPTVDAAELKLNKAQCDALALSGVKVLNAPAK